jgi:hypothetical protein
VFERFVEQSPMSVMARGAMEYALAADDLDRPFADAAARYRKHPRGPKKPSAVEAGPGAAARRHSTITCWVEDERQMTPSEGWLAASPLLAGPENRQAVRATARRPVRSSRSLTVLLSHMPSRRRGKPSPV